jgi:hypothetical protein
LTSREIWFAGLSGSALLALLPLGACRSAAVQGQSTIEVLEPMATPQPGTTHKAEASSDIIVDDLSPSLIGELAKPAYPANALAAHVGECFVFVTVTIDAKGAVSEAVLSWGRLNIPNRYSEEFLEAARTAVRSWRFEPARLVYWKRNGTGEPSYLYTEIVPAKADIKFTFEATGKVHP